MNFKQDRAQEKLEWCCVSGFFVSPVGFRTHLENNGVTRRSPFVRGEVVEDEAYGNMASPNDKPQPNGDRRSSQVFECFYS